MAVVQSGTLGSASAPYCSLSPQPLSGIQAARALLSGPEGSPEQAGKPLEQWAAAST